MKLHLDSIKGRTADIIEAVMAAPEIPQDDGLQFKIRLAVEEVAENIVNYAYSEGDGWIEVNLEQREENLEIVFRDGGFPFNPLQKDDPDITLSAEKRQIGGLGIFLCKQLMDSITYEYTDGCNVLKLGICK